MKIRIASEKSLDVEFLIKLLAHAAVIYGRFATATVIAGPEIRTIPANYDLIISDVEIGTPIICQPDMIICLDEIGYNAQKELIDTQENIMVFYDPVFVHPDKEHSAKMEKITAFAHAKKEFQSTELWKIVLLGSVIRIGRLVSLDSISQAIRSDLLESQIQPYLKSIDAGSKLSKKTKSS